MVTIFCNTKSLTKMAAHYRIANTFLSSCIVYILKDVQYCHPMFHSQKKSINRDINNNINNQLDAKITVY
jgi:hypothetical protein